MPKSKSQSKSSARVVRYGGLSEHPATRDLDPLLQARLGSPDPIRLPDSFSEPTAATVLRSEYTLSSDAAGELTWGENYNLTGSKLTATVTAGTIGTVATAQHPQYAAFVAEAKTARMVMMRIQVMYIGREDASSGYISFDRKTEPAYGGGTMGDGHLSSHVQHDAQHGLVVNQGPTQVPRWEVPSAATFMANTYSVPVFFASGLPASATVYRVRVWRFMEYLPLDNVLSEGNLETEPHNPHALTVSEMLGGVAHSVSTFLGFDDFKKTLLAGANAAYHIAAPMTPWVVGKARSYLKNAALGAGSRGLMGLATLMI